MLDKIARFFEDTIDDLGYSLKRAAAYVTGKSGVALLAVASIGILPIFGANGFESFISKAIGVAGVAGISGYLVQKDFEHRRYQFLERYKDEIGALLGKASDRVQEQDIALAARGDFKRGIPANSSFRRELRNSWLNRNVGVLLSATISGLTFLAVEGLDAGFFEGNSSIHHMVDPEYGNNLWTAITGEHKVDFFKALARNGLIGLITYHSLKTPAHWALSDLLGIDEHTVNDRITDIKRVLGHGREVQPEQVLGVFIHAHNEVREQFAAEYGKDYDQMSRKQQGELLEVVEQYMDIKKLTEHINTGRMRPEELIFAVYDQKSGIKIAEEEGKYHNNGNILDGMWRGLQAVTGGYKTNKIAREHLARVTDEIAAEMPGHTKVSVNAEEIDNTSMHVQNQHEDEQGRTKSFVARVGRTASPREDGSHVERLRQESTQEIITPAEQANQLATKTSGHHAERLRKQELTRGDLTPLGTSA